MEEKIQKIESTQDRLRDKISEHDKIIALTADRIETYSKQQVESSKRLEEAIKSVHEDLKHNNKNMRQAIDFFMNEQKEINKEQDKKIMMNRIWIATASGVVTAVIFLKDIILNSLMS